MQTHLKLRYSMDARFLHLSVAEKHTKDNIIEFPYILETVCCCDPGEVKEKFKCSER